MQQADPPIKKRPRPRLSVGIILLVLCLGLCATSEYVNQLDRAQQQARIDAVPTVGTISDPNPNAPVTCNGTPMSHSDICDVTHTLNGASITDHNDYAAQAAYQANQRIAEATGEREQERSKLLQNNGLSLLSLLSTILGVAGLAAAFAAFLTFVAYRKRRK